MDTHHCHGPIIEPESQTLRSEPAQDAAQDAAQQVYDPTNSFTNELALSFKAPSVSSMQKSSMFQRRGHMMAHEEMQRIQTSGVGVDRTCLPVYQSCINENSAQGIIQRAWLRKKYSHYVLKSVLMFRLEMESSILRGFLKLLLYSATLILLGLAVFGTDVSSRAKQEMVEVLTSVLGLHRLKSIATLDSFRSFLPVISERAKVFSVSSSARMTVNDGLSLLRERMELQKPVLLFSREAAPSVAADFTIAAWVERMYGSKERVALMRVPMQTDRSLDCWGCVDANVFHVDCFRLDAMLCCFHSCLPYPRELSCCTRDLLLSLCIVAPEMASSFLSS